MARCLINRLAAAVVLLGVTASPLAAQTLAADRPLIEVGVSGVLFGGLVDVSDLIGDPQSGAKGFSPHVTVKLTRRLGLEASIDVFRVEKEYSAASSARLLSSFHSLGLVIRHRESDDGRSFRFVRVGAGGHFESQRVPETRITRSDRSVVVFPAYQQREFTAVNFGFVGVGVQRTMLSHLAIRGGIDGTIGSSGLGVRLAAGISVPIGSYRAR